MVLGDFNQNLDFKHIKNYIVSPSVDKRSHDAIKYIIEWRDKLYLGELSLSNTIYILFQFKCKLVG